MYKDDKKYHMDLKENARGRFLKVSETFTRGYSRFQVRKSIPTTNVIPKRLHRLYTYSPRFSFLPREWMSSSKTLVS